MKKIREILYVFLFCIPFAIVVYILAHIGVLIYKLYKMTNPNDIEVKEFVDLSPSKETMMAIEIAQAKKLLKDNGYYVDNLWQTEDVKINYKCTEEQAQKVLNKVFQYDSIYELVWEAIGYEAESMKLKHKD